MTTAERAGPARAGVPGHDVPSRIRHLPNQLSATRLALIPVLWTLALLGKTVLVGAVLVAAALTDVLDGFIARRTRTATRFGSALDSVADHLLLASTAAFLVLLKPGFIHEQRVPLAVWGLLALATLAVGWVRHRRLGNLHLYSAKLAGVVGYVFVVTLLLFESYSRIFFAAALGLACVATGETLLVLLTRHQVDEHVGSVISPRR